MIKKQIIGIAIILIAMLACVPAVSAVFHYAPNLKYYDDDTSLTWSVSSVQMCIEHYGPGNNCVGLNNDYNQSYWQIGEPGNWPYCTDPSEIDAIYPEGSCFINYYKGKTGGEAPVTLSLKSLKNHTKILLTGNFYNGDGGLITWTHVSGPAPVPQADFLASPLNAESPGNITFYDNSAPIASHLKWTIVDPVNEKTEIAGGCELHTFSRILSRAGLYTVSLEACNGAWNCTNVTKTNYLNIWSTTPVNQTNTTGLIVNLDVKDATTGALIQNTGVGIRNTTSNIWRNSTAPTGLVYYDSTGLNHEFPLSKNQEITLAAWDTNYRPDSITFAIPYDNYRAVLNLVPNSLVLANGTGNVVVTVVRNKDGTPISGASIALETGQMGPSNSAGALTFSNISAGSHTVTVSTPTYAYSTASQSFTLSAGETKMVLVQLVLTGETPVPVYVSPVQTSIPGGSGSSGGATDSGALNSKGASGLANMMDMIINCWPLVFIIGFIYFMRKSTE